MIAETGLAALWLAAALALGQFGFGMLALGQQGARFRAALAPVAVVQALLVSLGFACLSAVFARSDMSVVLVA